MATTVDLTDRERLALALDHLHRHHGYWTPNPRPELLEPGPSCAVQAVPDGVPYVTWHAQADDVAFGYGWSATDDCPTCAEHADRLHAFCSDADHDPEAERIRRLWPDDTEDKLWADETSHVTEAHRNLASDLNLLWAGDPALVCRVLRRFGLDAREPEDDGTCIKVLPRWAGWDSLDREAPCWRGDGHRYKRPGTPVREPDLAKLLFPPRRPPPDEPTLFDPGPFELDLG